MEVEGPTTYELDAVCTGSSAAVRFLRSQGLRVDMPVKVRVVRRLPPEANAVAAGCYLPRDRTVYILAYAEYAALRAISDMPVSAGNYLSVAAHEVAHAIATANFTASYPSLLAQEYVACVAQLAALPEDERSSMLARFPGEGFESDLQISLTAYLMGPAWFCAQSYRHYLRRENGREFLRRALSGKAILQDE